MELHLATRYRLGCGPELKGSRSLSWLASVAVIKHGPKTTRGTKGFFFLSCRLQYITEGSQDRNHGKELLKDLLSGSH